MKKRSTMMVAIGAVIFVVGAGVVLLSLRTSTTAAAKTASAPAAAPSTPVVVATRSMPAGTSGEVLVAQQAVKLAPVPAGSYRADDLTSLQSLDEQALATSIAAGQPIESSQLRLAAGPLAPPAGRESIALTLSTGASGVAAYLAPGDEVNVYATITKLSSGVPAVGSPDLPCTALIDSSLPVLDVSLQAPAYRTNPSSTGRVDPASITVLLAATPTEARQLVFYTTTESLYLTQAGSGEPPLSTATCSALLTTPQLTPAS